MQLTLSLETIDVYNCGIFVTLPFTLPPILLLLEYCDILPLGASDSLKQFS